MLLSRRHDVRRRLPARRPLVPDVVPTATRTSRLLTPRGWALWCIRFGSTSTSARCTLRTRSSPSRAGSTRTAARPSSTSSPTSRTDGRRRSCSSSSRSSSTSSCSRRANSASRSDRRPPRRRPRPRPRRRPAASVRASSEDWTPCALSESAGAAAAAASVLVAPVPLQRSVGCLWPMTRRRCRALPRGRSGGADVRRAGADSMGLPHLRLRRPADHHLGPLHAGGDEGRSGATRSTSSRSSPTSTR